MNILDINSIEPSKQDLILLGRLSNSQWRVFKALASGAKIKDIAKLKGYTCTPKTVESHVAACIRKLNLNSSCELRAVSAKVVPYLRNKGFDRVKSERFVEFTKLDK